MVVESDMHGSLFYVYMVVYFYGGLVVELTKWLSKIDVGFEKRVLSKTYELVCPRLRWIIGARDSQFNSSAWLFLRFRLPAVRRWFYLRCCFGSKQPSFRGHGRGGIELTIWPWPLRGLIASPRRR